MAHERCERELSPLQQALLERTGTVALDLLRRTASQQRRRDRQMNIIQ
jgi:hypothetical protein